MEVSLTCARPLPTAVGVLLVPERPPPLGGCRSTDSPPHSEGLPPDPPVGGCRSPAARMQGVWEAAAPQPGGLEGGNPPEWGVGLAAAASPPRAGGLSGTSKTLNRLL